MTRSRFPANGARPSSNNNGRFSVGVMHGECYFDEESGRAAGWDTMWRNFMAKVLETTKVKERFTEHDLRARWASDAETLEHTRALLAHADGKMTERIDRRKPERVKPLRLPAKGTTPL